MNVLILAAGQDEFDTHDGAYPLCLTEIDGVPVVERLVNACKLCSDVNFIFALRKEDVDRYHLDSVASLLAPNARIIKVASGTKGAACTALLAAGWIDGEDELLVVSVNELLDIDVQCVVDGFRERGLDAGVVTFPSIHPRYSYVRLDEDGFVIEAAEKRPISRYALAGFFWFARGSDFVSAAKRMIRKDVHVDGLFYISPALNELVLGGRSIGASLIEANKYHPLKTIRQLDRFESSLGRTS